MEENETNRNAVAEWNTDLAKVLIPNDVILSLYIIFGFFGNSIVILVYRFRMTNKTEDRYFIPVLAVADLAGSIICGSFAIALNMMQAEFYNTHLCKAWWFFAAFTTYTCILLLTIIAVQRYLKVCRPLRNQMTLFHKRLAIGLALSIAVIFASPTTALYGSVDFPNAAGSIIGRRCSKLKSVSKLFPLVYGVALLFALITCISVMVYSYIRIGHKLYKHFKSAATFDSNSRQCGVKHFPSNFDSNVATEKDTCTTDISQSSLDNLDMDRGCENHKNENNFDALTTEKKTENETDTEKRTKTKTTNHDQQNKRIMNKITIMFMLITIVFMICYIPKVILTTVEGLDPKFWEKFSDSQRAGVLFIYRSYILNNVINPFIYAFMDLEFRKETKAFLICS